MFKAGDRVAWKAYAGLPIELQRGSYWDGPNLAPRGYLVVDVLSTTLIRVEDKSGNIHTMDANKFVRVAGGPTRRNLPEWF